MTNNKILILIPCFGKPYIVADKTNELENLQYLVGGNIEILSNKKFSAIHPSFAKNNKEWKTVSVLYDKRKRYRVKIIVNENGRYECSPNMAVIGETGIPIFGDIVLVMTTLMSSKFLDETNENHLPVINCMYYL